MTDIVKIDLNSIKKNPNAGNTQSMVQGRIDHYISFDIDDLDKTKNLPEDIRVVGYSHKPESPYEVQCMAFKFSEEDLDKIKDLGVKNLQWKTNNNSQTIHHAPEPEYFFEREDSEVECGSCKAKMPISKVKEDDIDDDEGFGGYRVEICPDCGDFNSFDFKHETIQEALKRKE